MARKRKIPVRKHHGVRDPLRQLEQREKKLANVTNNPPTQNDEQRASHNFKQFKKLADAAKAGKKVKLASIGREDKPKVTGSKKVMAAAAAAARSKKNVNIKKFDDETNEEYLRRVNRITNASVREAQYEAKYGVNIIRNPTTGEITLQKRPKNEIDELLKQKQKERLNFKNGRKKPTAAVKPGIDAKTRKELIKRAFKEADEEEKQQQQKDAPIAEYKRDVFKFGETVHAPPTIKTLPRKASKNETVPRPGRKSNLLLKSLINKDEEKPDTESQETDTPSKKKAAVQKTPTKLQMKGKRKDLPAATRNMLEGERNKMVDLYRQLKKKQQQENAER